jgi:hypothetical protein
MNIESSPFAIAGPAAADDLIGRQNLLSALMDRAARGRFVLLTAPRRYGKTTLVRRLARDAAQGKDLAVVIVDLLGVQTLDDIALRMAQAWTRLPSGPIAKAVARVLPFVSGISVAGGVVGLTLQGRASAAPGTLESVLDIPRAVAERTGRRILVVLDEFQAIAGIDRADAIIRSQIQHQTEVVSYLFAGSDQSVTEMLFTDRTRPLYGQAERITLPPFDPDALASYVEDRFAGTDRSITSAALAAYLEVVAGHPQRSMLVADAAWATVQAEGTVDLPELARGIDDAISRCADEFTVVLGLLTDAQARVARLVAWNQPLTGAAAARLSLSQGAARAAAKTLSDRGILALRDKHRAHVDPLFAEWLRRLGPMP